MQVGRDGVAAPDHDQLAVLVLLDVHADRRADGRGPARPCRPTRRSCGRAATRRADGRSGGPSTRPAAAPSSPRSCRAGSPAAVRGRCDGCKACRDRCQRLVPGDALEPAFALAADAPHRMQHALVRVGPVEIARDLRAQHAAGGRMIGRAANRDRAAVLDCRQQRAGVGTVVRAGAAHDASSRKERADRVASKSGNSTGLCTTAASAYPCCRWRSTPRCIPWYLADGHARSRARASARGRWASAQGSAAREIAALRAGIDLGMTLIDTAEMYGDGGAERVVARAIARRPRRRVRRQQGVSAQRAARRARSPRASAASRGSRPIASISTCCIGAAAYPLAETVDAFERLRARRQDRALGRVEFRRRRHGGIAGASATARIAQPIRCCTTCRERGIEWRLRALCQQHDMPIMAYSPLRSGRAADATENWQLLPRRSASRRRSSRSRGCSRNASVIAIPQSSNVDHVARVSRGRRRSPVAGRAGGDRRRLSAAATRTSARHAVIAARSSAGCPRPTASLVAYKTASISDVSIGCNSPLPGGGTLAAYWWSPGLDVPRNPDRRSSVTYTHYDYLDLAPGASPARIEAAYAAVLERFQYGATRRGPGPLRTRAHDSRRVRSAVQSRAPQRSYDAHLAREAAEADAELKIDARCATRRRHAARAGRARGVALAIHVARGLTATSAIPKVTAAGKVFFPDCKQRCGRRPYSPPGTQR